MTDAITKAIEALEEIRNRLHTAVGAGVVEPPTPQLAGTRSGHIQAALFSVIETANAALTALQEQPAPAGVKSDIVEKLKARLASASINDRRYERPMTWEEADELVAFLSALQPSPAREETREKVWGDALTVAARCAERRGSPEIAQAIRNLIPGDPS